MKEKAIFSRFMATTTDLVITLIPILVWDLIVFIVLAGFLPSSVMTFLDKVILYVIIVSFCVTNPLITLIYGKTLGQMVFDIRINDVTGKKATSIQLALREFLGGMILLGCSYIYYGLGVFIYLILNMLIILLNKRARGLVDFICHTKPISVVFSSVEEKKKKKRVEKEVQEELPVHLKSDSFYHYDLHVHSKHSLHGQETVEELFQNAKSLGVEVISITDLFSVKANYEAEVLSKPYGIQYIPGIELECEFEGYSLNVLGYNIDYTNTQYIQLENEYVKLQRECSLKRIEKFKEVSGIDMNISRLINQNASGIVSEEMIVQEVLNNPLYDTIPFLQKYLKEDRKKAYRHLYLDYFASDKPCYVKASVLSLQEIVSIIKNTGGTSILAYPKKRCGDDSELIKRILAQGVDGLEVFSPYHDENDIKNYLEIVREVNCFVSSGSDYYGILDLMIQMGDTKATSKYEKLIRILIDRSLKKVEQRG